MDNPSSKAAHRSGDIRQEPVVRLLLDRENPRLTSVGPTAKQFDILKILWTEMAVDELVLSIAANGYFPEEPLFVIPDEPGAPGAKFVVIEGNRRLAAVLILTNDAYRRELKATNIPAIGDEEKEKLRTLPVSEYGSREQLWEYLSFRHINSPKPWDAFSKARYAALVHDSYGVALDDIARKIGDRHETVIRLYRGYKVLQQAERTRQFDVDDVARNRFYFSHLYTALAYREFQDFLGMDADGFREDDPVPDSHLAQLEELMIWLYGKRSEQIPPVVQKQGRDLPRLKQVISSREALDALRSGYPLETAFSTSVGDNVLFGQSLATAKQELKAAIGTVGAGYDGNPEQYKTALDIEELAKGVKSEMKRKMPGRRRGTSHDG